MSSVVHAREKIITNPPLEACRSRESATSSILPAVEGVVR
jgi:hypothetical protein